jgi:hypothetical protein
MYPPTAKRVETCYQAFVRHGIPAASYENLPHFGWEEDSELKIAAPYHGAAVSVLLLQEGPRALTSFRR